MFVKKGTQIIQAAGYECPDSKLTARILRSVRSRIFFFFLLTSGEEKRDGVKFVTLGLSICLKEMWSPLGNLLLR